MYKSLFQYREKNVLFERCDFMKRQNAISDDNAQIQFKENIIKKLEGKNVTQEFIREGLSQ